MIQKRIRCHCCGTTGDIQNDAKLPLGWREMLLSGLISNNPAAPHPNRFIICSENCRQKMKRIDDKLYDSMGIYV
jgi:hypothetical protein